MSILPLVVVFIFGAVVLGAGAMLAPALPVLPTMVRQQTAPRIGLSAALVLALVITGVMFLAAIFGWNTLTIDYLWFAILVGIFLSGTLSLGVLRGKATGLSDAQPGWPGVRELAFFLLLLAGLTVPVLVLPVPLDTDAQGFGYLALMMRESGSITTLAPFHPEIEYLYSPGFTTLAAYLSQQLGIGLHTIQFATAAVLALTVIWLLWDFGNAFEDWLIPPGLVEIAGDSPPARHAGAIMAGLGILGTGLLTAYMDSHFTTVMALVFTLAFLMFVARYLRGSRWLDAIAAAVCLGAVPLTHPDTTIILAVGYVPWLLTIWLAKPRPTLRQWMVIALGVPLVALLGILPWIIRILPLLGSDIASPFATSLSHWKVLIFMHGGVIVPFVLGGAVIAARRRNPLDVLMIGWLIFVIDFSTTGILDRVTFGLLHPVTKYHYPFSVAWHGPIIPYAYLATSAVLWLAARIGWRRLRRWWDRIVWPGMALAAAALVLAVIFAGPLLQFSKGRIGFFGAFSSHADVQAMEWLKENTPGDAYILNFPGDQEGDWAPIISERDTVYFRPQPFFQHTAQAEAVQASLYGFWEDPADLLWQDRLRGYGVDYVLVPQVFANPESLAEMWRWQEPFAWRVQPVSSLADAPYLERVADFDGAQVWRVLMAD